MSKESNANIKSEDAAEGTQALRTNRDVAESGGSSPPPSAQRELETQCYECGYPTIEEKRNFKGEMLAVCVCLNPKCPDFDWICPKGEEYEDTDSTAFAESEDWAREQAHQMKMEFAAKHALVIKVEPTSHHIDKFLNDYGYAPSSHRIIRNYLEKFMRWFERNYKEEP